MIALKKQQIFSLFFAISGTLPLCAQKDFTVPFTKPPLPPSSSTQKVKPRPKQTTSTNTTQTPATKHDRAYIFPLYSDGKNTFIMLGKHVKWLPLGGQAKPGESSRQTAARELYEETGKVIDIQHCNEKLSYLGEYVAPPSSYNPSPSVAHLYILDITEYSKEHPEKELLPKIKQATDDIIKNRKSQEDYKEITDHHWFSIATLESMINRRPSRGFRNTTTENDELGNWTIRYLKPYLSLLELHTFSFKK